jgi:ribonuclease HII
MKALDEAYPGYGLAKHKGYPTAQHLEALQHLGITPIHRKSFAPVARMLDRQDEV